MELVDGDERERATLDRLPSKLIENLGAWAAA